MEKIVIALISVVVLAFNIYPSNKKEVPTLDGIDVSHWNDINISDYKSVYFMYAKATQGATGKDPKFNYFKNEAKKYNIKFGAYHFLTTVDVYKQFDNFRRIAGKCDCVPMLDVEGSDINKLDTKTLQKMIDIWIDLCLKHYKTKPIIYCNEFLHNKLNLKGCLWWVDAETFRYKYDVNTKEPQGDYFIWQYTIHKYGYNKKIDYNYISKKYNKNLILCP